VSLILIALALGFATMIMGHVSSAAHWERFISYLQLGFIYAVGPAIFTTVVFALPFYAILLIGRLVLSWI